MWIEFQDTSKNLLGMSNMKSGTLQRILISFFKYGAMDILSNFYRHSFYFGIVTNFTKWWLT